MRNEEKNIILQRGVLISQRMKFSEDIQQLTLDMVRKLSLFARGRKDVI